MGLADVFKAAAVTIMKAAGDIPASGVYHSAGTFTYNPATGLAPETSDTDITITTGILMENYSSREIDGDKIRNTDKKFLIPSNLLSVIPAVDDYITVSSVRWTVVGIDTDPAGAMWSLQCRP